FSFSHLLKDEGNASRSTMYDNPALRAAEETFDVFDFDTIHACEYLGITPMNPWSGDEVPCLDNFHTRYEFGRAKFNTSPEESSFYDESLAPNQQGRVINGFRVDFDHTLDANDVIDVKGAVLFAVRGEDVAYSLEGSYEILGGQSDIHEYDFHVELLELRFLYPELDGWERFGWVPLVAERKSLGTTILVTPTPWGGVTTSTVPLNASDIQYSLGTSTDCPKCDEGVSKYTGILKQNRTYKLSYRAFGGRNIEAADPVFPSGGVALVVPEPSSNLMAFA
ncbi:unnamed protein product, partial [marine sediment metagenome]